jgi:putative ABC transport system permease protein
MKVIRFLRLSVESIFVHKLRAILTMLGIIIGVAAVVTTIGIGRGAAANITQRIESQGTNLLIVLPSAASSGGVSQGGGSARTLTMGDVAALQQKLYNPSLEQVVPVYSGNTQLVYNGVNNQNSVVGTTAAYASVRNLTIADGSFLTDEQVTQESQVVVLGATLATTLFGKAEPVGQRIFIQGQPFTVIGVLQATGGEGFASNDTIAFVPISVAQARLFNAPRYRGKYLVNDINIDVVSASQIPAAEQQIETTLRLDHNLTAAEADDFSIFNQQSLLNTAASISQTLTIFLGAVGAISLLVGGIGIMNIMLVSVTERTHEIGVRRAVGAHDRHILLQFLIEALVLTAIGGVVGIGLSYGIAAALAHVPGVTFQVIIAPDTMILAVGVSLIIGVVFGIYPAMRATQLDPIEALRYE